MHRERIAIEINVATGDNNQPVYEGTMLVTNWPATIKSTGGGEQIRGRVIEPHITWVVSAHWGGAIKGVKQSMRVLVTAGEFVNRVLNIEKVLPEEVPGEPHQFQMHCTEVGQ